MTWTIWLACTPPKAVDSAEPEPVDSAEPHLPVDTAPPTETGDDTAPPATEGDTDTPHDTDAPVTHPVLDGALPLGDAWSRLLGEGPGDYAGQAVAAGDLDGDGLGDAIVGAKYAGGDLGRVYAIVDGGGGDVGLETATHTWTGDELEGLFGAAVEAADVDDDGLVDVLAGAYSAGERGQGVVAVFSAGAGTGPADAAAVLVGNSPGDRFGYDLAAAGDGDGDGLAELLVGAPRVDAGLEDVGKVLLFEAPLAGELSQLDAVASWRGASEGAKLGYAVKSAGDVDADGLDDLVLGAYAHTETDPMTGAVYLVTGWSEGDHDASDADATVLGEFWEDYVGWSVSGAGDLDGDGYGDLLIGALGIEDGGYNAGAGLVFLGPLDGEVLASEAHGRWIGEATGAHAGLACVGAGDLDGDELDDVVFTAVGSDTGPDHAGVVYVFYGLPEGSVPLADADVLLYGEAESAGAGFDVEAAGDVDGDGWGDLLVGAYKEPTRGDYAGAAYLVRTGRE